MGVVYLSLQISIVLTATQTCYANRPTAENLIFSSTSASVVIRCGTSSSVKSSSTLKSKSQTAGQLRLRRTKAKKRLQPGQWLHSSRYPQIFREGQGENARHLQLFHLEIFAQYQPKIKCSRPCTRCLMQKFIYHMVPIERDPKISRDAFPYNDKIHTFWDNKENRSETSNKLTNLQEETRRTLI